MRLISGFLICITLGASILLHNIHAGDIMNDTDIVFPVEYRKLSDDHVMMEVVGPSGKNVVTWKEVRDTLVKMRKDSGSSQVTKGDVDSAILYLIQKLIISIYSQREHLDTTPEGKKIIKKAELSAHSEIVISSKLNEIEQSKLAKDLYDRWVAETAKKQHTKYKVSIIIADKPIVDTVMVELNGAKNAKSKATVFAKWLPTSKWPTTETVSLESVPPQLGSVIGAMQAGDCSSQPISLSGNMFAVIYLHEIVKNSKPESYEKMKGPLTTVILANLLNKIVEDELKNNPSTKVTVYDTSGKELKGWFAEHTNDSKPGGRKGSDKESDHDGHDQSNDDHDHGADSASSSKQASGDSSSSSDDSSSSSDNEKKSKSKKSKDDKKS